jgi:hypothetical protein
VLISYSGIPIIISYCDPAGAAPSRGKNDCDPVAIVYGVSAPALSGGRLVLPPDKAPRSGKIRTIMVLILRRWLVPAMHDAQLGSNTSKVEDQQKQVHLASSFRKPLLAEAQSARRRQIHPYV